jgi:hypothetical protein
MADQSDASNFQIFAAMRAPRLAPFALALAACAADSGDPSNAADASPSAQSAAIASSLHADARTRPVDPSLFVRDALLADISLEERVLSDGSSAMCYVIRSKSVPYEHEMGPWSPKHVTDGAEQGGIWMKDGAIYDVDGPFVAAIGKLYSDPTWNLVREDGSIRVTSTKEAFEAAARPNVDPQYHNHVVEGRPEWIGEMQMTFVVPVHPVYRDEPTNLGRGAIGIAFNGVNFDPPAPLHAILAAHTIAPLDDSGGHLNPHEGYHYHAATGHTKEVAQSDGHAPMIGYALDGFAIYAHVDADQREPEGLDECGGHTDLIRGFHYHAGAPGSNRIIGAFRGVPGTARVDSEGADASEPNPPRGAPRPPDRRGPPKHD